MFNKFRYFADEDPVKIANQPTDEVQRLEFLRSIKILDSAPERYLNDLVKLASQICETPIAAISLIDSDRQWFKASTGLAVSETPRDMAFCSHLILQDELVEIPNALVDDRFHDNPLVVGSPFIRFYAGVPLKNEAGIRYGTLCVIDTKPRVLRPDQKETLQILARAVSSEINKRALEAHKLRMDEINMNLQNEVQESSKILSAIAEQVPGTIYQYQLFPDGRSCFPFSSRGIEKIYEVTPESVRQDASLVLQRLHPEDYQQVVDSILVSAENLTLWSCDYRVILPQAGVRWLHGNSRPERLCDGSTLWHGFITDITERKNLSYQLQVASKMSTLGEMAAGIAHEINNPLSVILGRAQFAKAQIHKAQNEQGPGLPPEKILESFAKIEETTQRIAKIVKGLKSFSRTSADEKFELTSLAKLLTESSELCLERYRQKGVELRKAEVADFDLECRSIQISQVLVILMNNAFDAIHRSPQPWVSLEAQKVGEEAVIRVMDSGLGIPHQIVDQIMNPFFTTKPVGEGTGLGLSIAQGILREHGGTLSYISDAANTCFEIRLPIRQAQQHPEHTFHLAPVPLLKAS